MTAEPDWQMGQRGGEPVLWRWCDCDGWATEEVAIRPGDRHHRERVPNVPVEVCYFVDEAAHAITVLRIRSMPPIPSEETS